MGLILKFLGMHLGANAISTFSIQTATSCRLLDRYQQLARESGSNRVQIGRCRKADSDRLPAQAVSGVIFQIPGIT